GTFRSSSRAPWRAFRAPPIARRSLPPSRQPLRHQPSHHLPGHQSSRQSRRCLPQPIGLRASSACIPTTLIPGAIAAANVQQANAPAVIDWANANLLTGLWEVTTLNLASQLSKKTPPIL